MATGWPQQLIGVAIGLIGGALVTVMPPLGVLVIAIGIAILAWGLILLGKEKRILQPIHLIVIGTAGAALFVGIALAGIVWQAFWPVNATTTDHASQSAISTQSTQRQLSPADVNERIEAIGKAYNITLRAKPIADNALNIIQSQQLWPMIKGDTAPAFLQKYADDFKPILDDMQEFAKRYRNWLPDVDKAFLGDPYTPYVIGLHRNTLELRAEILNWASRPYNLDHIERSAMMADWRRSLESLPVWLSQSQTTLIALRRKYEDSQR